MPVACMASISVKDKIPKVFTKKVSSTESNQLVRSNQLIYQNRSATRKKHQLQLTGYVITSVYFITPSQETKNFSVVIL